MRFQAGWDDLGHLRLLRTTVRYPSILRWQDGGDNLWWSICTTPKEFIAKGVSSPSRLAGISGVQVNDLKGGTSEAAHPFRRILPDSNHQRLINPGDIPSTGLRPPLPHTPWKTLGKVRRRHEARSLTRPKQAGRFHKQEGGEGTGRWCNSICPYHADESPSAGAGGVAFQRAKRPLQGRRRANDTPSLVEVIEPLWTRDATTRHQSAPRTESQPTKQLVTCPWG